MPNSSNKALYVSRDTHLQVKVLAAQLGVTVDKLIILALVRLMESSRQLSLPLDKTTPTA